MVSVGLYVLKDVCGLTSHLLNEDANPLGRVLSYIIDVGTPKAGSLMF
jgi:hypothetical protein